MIRYPIFDFAAPPRTGVSWFLAAAQLAGLGPGFRHGAHVPFSGSVRRGFRVSLVRHPCDWLASCYAVRASRGPSSNGMAFANCLDLGSFDEFVRSYLRKRPGAVGRLYNEYEADARLRIEDVPWSFIELMESFGIIKEMREKCVKLGRRSATPDWNPRWDGGMRRAVLGAERETCDAHEYC